MCLMERLTVRPKLIPELVVGLDLHQISEAEKRSENFCAECWCPDLARQPPQNNYHCTSPHLDHIFKSMQFLGHDNMQHGLDHCLYPEAKTAQR
jgi:hypothetical protein